MPEFFQCLGYRSVRRIVKDFPAYTLDRFITFPKWIKTPVMKKVKPLSDWFENAMLCHDEAFKRLFRGKSMSLYDWFKKTVFQRELQSYLFPFKVGDFFWGSSKIGLTTFTWYEIVRDTHDAYKNTKNVAVAREMFIHQSIKWFVGMVVGAIGSDYGFELHPKKGLITSYICAIIASAVFDYFWNPLEPKVSLLHQRYL